MHMHMHSTYMHMHSTYMRMQLQPTADIWLQARRLCLELPWPEALRFPQAQARTAAPLDLCIDALRRCIAARIPACLPARVHTCLRTYRPTRLRVLLVHA